MDAKKKRERGRNYVEEEKNALVDIALRFRKIIENRSTDGVTLAEKNEAWAKIASKYNSSVAKTGERTPNQLRQLYETLKCSTKKQLSNNKVDLHKTGGGPSSFKLTCLQEKIAAIGGLQFVPPTNKYDSNSDFEKKSQIEEFEGFTVETLELDPTPEPTVPQTPTPEFNTTPKSPTLDKQFEYVMDTTPPEAEIEEVKLTPAKKIKKTFIQRARNNQAKNKSKPQEHEDLLALKKKKLERELEILEVELQIKKIELQIKETQRDALLDKF